MFCFSKLHLPEHQSIFISSLQLIIFFLFLDFPSFLCYDELNTNEEQGKYS